MDAEGIFERRPSMKIKQLSEGLDSQQRSVPELPAQFRPAKISVLKSKTDPRHPMTGYAVGANESRNSDNDPYEQGWRAGHRRGQDETACPYKSGTPEHAQWMDGYKEAQAQPGHYDESAQVTHKGGQVTKTATGIRHQAAPGNYGGYEPEKDTDIKLDKTRTVGLEKGMGVRFKRKKAWQGGVDLDESITKEDIISKLKARLGDYLSDISKEIKKDPDLVDKLSAKAPGDQMGPPVKTVTTDDGHEIQIHGNEDDGFRVSIKNKTANSKFNNLDEAVMACEMYCAHRRGRGSQDYLDEA
jgi:hypothetical protein